jgi:iron complex outermembrane recepter protein
VQVSMGASLHLPMLAVEAGVFASSITDYIAFGPERDGSGKPIVDVLITGAVPRFSSQATDARMSGVDGGIIIAPDGPVSLRVQAAVVRGVDVKRRGYLPFMPPPQARTALDMHLLPVDALLRLKHTQLTVDVVTVAQQTRTDAGTDFVPPAVGYALWNASGSTDVDLWGVVVRAGVEVKNIGNARVRDQLSLLRFFADQPGREVWLRLSVPLGTRP